MLPGAFNARVLGKMLARVLVRQDAGSRFMQPLVATGVVEVPVSVYQLSDGIRVDARERFRNVWTRRDDFRINEQLSVRASKNGYISASAQKDTDIAAKVLHRDFCYCGFLERIPDEVVCLGE